MLTFPGNAAEDCIELEADHPGSQAKSAMRQKTKPQTYCLRAGLLTAVR